MTTVRRLPVLWLILLESTWCAATVFSQVEYRRAPSARNEIDAKLKVSVDRGFRYLLSKKRPSGDFDAEFPVAVDALVGLAFLAGGYTERTGPSEYAAAVRSCTTALLKRQLPCGYFSDGRSRMYGHGFATLYFADKLFPERWYRIPHHSECLERLFVGSVLAVPGGANLALRHGLLRVCGTAYPSEPRRTRRPTKRCS